MSKIKIAVSATAAILMVASPVSAQDSKFFKRVGSLEYLFSNRKMVTALSDGRIIFFGGQSRQSQDKTLNRYGQNFRKVVIFDPRKRTVQALEDSPLDLYRKDAQAILLPSNKILICGSDLRHEQQDELYPSICECAHQFSAADEIANCQKTTAVLYDPKTKDYKFLSNIRPVRVGSSSTVLNDGRVILIGGKISSKERLLQRIEGRRPNLPESLKDVRDYNEREAAIKSIDPETDADRKLCREIQLYDPEEDGIKTVGTLPDNMNLHDHAALSVDAYRLLIIGGVTNSGASRKIFIYSLHDQSFQEIAELNFARQSPVVIPLSDERFLIVGGVNKNAVDRLTRSAKVGALELFDLKSKVSKVIAAFEPEASGQPTAIKLADGRVLLIAGFRPGQGEAVFFGRDRARSDVALLDPGTGKITKIDKLTPGRSDSNAITTSDGKIYIFGGSKRDYINFNHSGGGLLSTIEEFDYETFKQQYGSAGSR